MSESKPILFYDIASGPPRRSYAPNPWKVRFALNFKQVNYETRWVELPDVTTTRRDVLNMSPCRTHLDGSDYYTMPVIHDTATNVKVGDSFEIIQYLDKTYPSAKRTLIPSGEEASMRAWNEKCNAVFSGTTNTFGSIGLLYAHGLPFNPDTADISKAKFVATVPGMKSWDDFNLVGQERQATLGGFKVDLHELATHFKKRELGPYLDGDVVTYADFIVGAWLKFLSVCLPEWTQVKTWDDAIWNKLLKNLEENYGQER